LIYPFDLKQAAKVVFNGTPPVFKYSFYIIAIIDGTSPALRIPGGDSSIIPRRGFINAYLLTISLPKGDKAIAVNLKCCKPNGIPMIVIHKINPNTACVIAIQIPPVSSHIIFMSI
jgi:hypothetical protein